MTSGLLTTIFGLALVDSINPSAIGVTLYLLLTARSPAGKVLTYLAAVAGAYFVIGALLMLGLDALLTSAGAYLEHPITYAIQGGWGRAW